MTPKQIRSLNLDSWITWTRSIWSTPINGSVVGLPRPGEFLVEWDDGHTSLETTENLGRKSFQPREERPLHRVG